MTPRAAVLDAADRPDGGVSIIELPRGVAGAECRAIAQALCERGYAVADVADVAVATEIQGERVPRQLRYRHVALWCVGAAARARAVTWVRAVSQVSPRRHLVMCVPERLTAVGDKRWTPSRLRSLASARAEEHGSPSAVIARARQLVDRGEWPAASQILGATLREPDVGWKEYAEAAALATDLALTRGDLSFARDWLTSLVAEADLRRVPLPASARARRAEVEFWRGRAQPLPAVWTPGPASAEEAGWIALSAWSKGQLVQAAAIAGQVTTRWAGRDRRAAAWARLLIVLLGGRRAGVANMAALEQAARDSALPFRFRVLSAAMVVRARALMGQAQDVAPSREWARAADPAARLLAVWRNRLRARQAGPPAPAAGDVAEWLGWQCLITERTQMHLIEGVAGLLAVMEDAEDELGALAGGCQWVRKHAGAEAVAIVSADHTRLVAAQGWKPTDLSRVIALEKGEDGCDAGVAAPVRYGGVTLGRVVARARTEDLPVVREAAEALAAVSGSALSARLDVLALQDRARECAPEILGRSPAMADVRQAIARAAVTTFPVLIEGESGTGKELVARALHRLSARRDRRFQAVNCAALTDDLVEAELFGHVRGAFTGAVGPRAGLFEEAHGGTLFLDEISELSPRAQAKLLRVLQEREVRRVGENAARRVDVRPIAATNVPLAHAVAQGRFRDDLRFRLAVVRITLPPLRDRLDDLPVLAQQFWRRAIAETGKRAVLGSDALARLARHRWPGNVRELQNVMAGLAVAAPARGRVTARHVTHVLSHAADDDAGVVPLETARRVFEQRLIAAALARHAGRRAAAARDLGLTRQGLTKAIRRLGLAATDRQEAEDTVEEIVEEMVEEESPKSGVA